MYKIKRVQQRMNIYLCVLVTIKNQLGYSMANHTLKTDPVLFSETWDGVKKFEVRKNDRDYPIGDILVIKETRHCGEEMSKGACLTYTNRSVALEVISILHGKDVPYGLDDDWVVMSVDVIAKSDSKLQDDYSYIFNSEIPDIDMHEVIAKKNNT